MEIPYKYKIGQKVKFIEGASNNGTYQGRDDFKEIEGKTVTIINRGFTLYYKSEKYNKTYTHSGERLIDGLFCLTVYYYIKEDPYINKGYHTLTKINEECLEGEDSNDLVDEVFRTVDGYDIIPDETRVYEDVLKNTIIEDKDGNRHKVLEANTGFGFSSYGVVCAMRKNYKINAKISNANILEIMTYKEFLCNFAPGKDGISRPRKDACKYGNMHWIYLNTIENVYAKIPKNYPEIFVKTAFSNGFYSFKGDIDPFCKGHIHWWEIDQWLKFMKMYSRTRKLFKAKMPKEMKEATEKYKARKLLVKKCKKYIDKLTEEEKEIFRKLL